MVNGTKDPEFKPYRQMLAGLDAFEQHQQLAPAALPRFVLRPQQADAGVNAVSGVSGVTLRIAGDTTSIDVPLAADGTFSLPRNQSLAAEANADLLLNRKKGLYRWRPDIRSPDVPAGARRLGDLRLECEMRWAVEQEDLSFVKRTLFRTMGGPCRSANIFVLYPAPEKLAGVSLASGQRRESLAAERLAGSALFYAPPLHDRSWPDDTLVEFEFAARP
ncbi:MAG: hypothetical protein V4488_17575 [Pseudomonadota bacterium]